MGRRIRTGARRDGAQRRRCVPGCCWLPAPPRAPPAGIGVRCARCTTLRGDSDDAGAKVGTWAGRPGQRQRWITCSASTEDDLSLIITATLLSTDKVNERAETIASFDGHIEVDGLPVSYQEDERSFEAQAACGMIVTVVRGPTVEGVAREDREALARKVVQLAGCEKLPDVPATPPPLDPLAR